MEFKSWFFHFRLYGMENPGRLSLKKKNGFLTLKTILCDEIRLEPHKEKSRKHYIIYYILTLQYLLTLKTEQYRGVP